MNTPAEYELLAPAGDISCFNSAIACGADAVYLGLSDFNARRKAENFSADKLRDCVKRAHFYGVKVYVTVNTLVKDSEIASLLSLVREAVEAKADAFIVQDLGVAACLKSAFPGIVLHASTQLGVHNLYGAKIAERAGFKRVVLARETKLEDIRAIRDNTELEIEYFVQGALCVAFSGNCYLSAKECGASGNRGLCKQLCRLPYKAELDGLSAEGYLLSARDLCLADSLNDLTEVGVTSFKIEGRMRRAEYVGSAVRVYRKLLDGLKNTAAAVSLTEDDLRELSIAYSRGDEYLERAYLDNGTPLVIEKRFNNHTGISIGIVKRVKSFKSDLYEVTVDSDCALKSGDGLKFFRSVDGGKLVEAASAGIGDVRNSVANLYTFVTKTAVKEGWQVNLISSNEQNDIIKNAARKVDLDLNIRAVAGEPLTIEASCDLNENALERADIIADGKINAADNRLTVELRGGICQKAINAPTDESTLLSQLIKVGDSGFAVCNASAHAGNAFVAKSEINALRRKTLQTMTEALISARESKCARVDEKAISELCVSKAEANPAISRRLRFISDKGAKNGEQIITDIREIAVLRPSEYSVEKIKEMLKDLSLTDDKVAMQLPVIANGRDIAVIENILKEFSGIKTLISENIYGLEFANRGYKIIAGAGHNALNGYAFTALNELGASEVLPSVESGTQAYANEIPLMTFAHCPYKTLFGNDCAQCTYKDGLILSRDRRRYRVERTKIHNCYFGLFEI